MTKSKKFTALVSAGAAAHKLQRTEQKDIEPSPVYHETEYWLELFVKADVLDREIAKDLYNQCGTIRRLLIASINTAKENMK